MATETAEDLDVRAGLVPHHHLGSVIAFDHDTGLPIVKRNAQTIPSRMTATIQGKEGQNAPNMSSPVAQATPAAIFEKGQTVSLPDGTRAKVSHVVASMKTVRVRTEDGRNLTIRWDALKPIGSALVKELFRGATT